MCAHRNKTEKETLDRSERSSLDFPIIVLKKNGKYHMILDGHHRLLKAKNKINEEKYSKKYLHFLFYTYF